ncbi:beta-glucosidase [Thermosporothrix hazakensis]|jgi:beta-glucosidase|uniref:Beta-glucosidase n=1 Tax=Thermosporothrix hazakensis TaxID=644383 RepID=A0A326U6N9_THEHA|nr:family 1 glycosylhydrolase [Thermosporothrix hazakensis]PZW30468.1 beta-glucosidase [Thermosporothrix hazakensis]GCE49328.1 beta-glucosidase [Thermosporothrix hazakensis]
MGNSQRLPFPDGFLWGTASSSYQCEGGNINNQWYRWEEQGRILSGEHCGDAANWWEAAEHDFELAEQMENNALRLSIEWSRVEPSEGRWDSAAIDRYRAMLQDLRQRNITPAVTLHHFTEPLWFVERGGFARRENIRLFLRYVHHVVDALQDLCSFWITINEPNVYAVEGYLLKNFPPGEGSILRTFQVLHHLMQAHVDAFYVIRRLQPQAMIGYCLHYRLFDPADARWPLDRAVAGAQDTFFNWAALRATETGFFPFPLKLLLEPVYKAPGARDYHGINYYTRELVRFDPTVPFELFGRRFVKPDTLRNDKGLDQDFGEIYPEGMYRVLQGVYRRTRGNKPLYITENGFCDALDDRRPRAILEHLAMVWRAIQEGIPVRGYFYWSLTDNFEWNNGWYARFGLIDVDPKTQVRTPRPSASMFGEICRANAITEEIVARYAPEALETIFGRQKETQSELAV